MASRDSVLVVFDGSPEQIHAASRARISGLILDLVLISAWARRRDIAVIQPENFWTYRLLN